MGPCLGAPATSCLVVLGLLDTCTEPYPGALTSGLPSPGSRPGCGPRPAGTPGTALRGGSARFMDAGSVFGGLAGSEGEDPVSLPWRSPESRTIRHR